MIVNGVELENIDICDIEVAEKYELGLKKLKKVQITQLIRVLLRI